MPFEPDKIKRQHVFEAVRHIRKNSIPLHPSTGYDVVIEGQRFPPKEIIRYSYLIATGEPVGRIYGGEYVNKHLRSLGFAIEQKSDVWKLGCNWNTGTPSFYNYIKERGIVISHERYTYKPGDLVLITEGFTVYAIAKVEKTPQAIDERYIELRDLYEVDFQPWVLIAKATWHELPRHEVFTYELIQGIRRVRKNDVIRRTFEIWDNRDFKISSLKFYIKNYHDAKPESLEYPFFVLTPVQSRSDLLYLTYFELYYYTSESRDLIGVVKILQKEQVQTLIPNSFSELPDNFCSLGQTVSYYTRLKDDFSTSCRAILAALRDCALDDVVYQKFKDEEGFKESLIKTSEAANLLLQAKYIVSGDQDNLKKRLDFQFCYKMNGAAKEHEVNFNFHEKEGLTGRINCIIGKNGTGKTRYIAQLADKLCDNSKEGQFKPGVPSFSKTIAISFSYFDKFRLPDKSDTSYELIGLRSGNNIIDEDILTDEIWRTFLKLSEDRSRKALWSAKLMKCLDDSFLDFDLSELEYLPSKDIFKERIKDIFSSGQKILFHLLTRLIASIETNSIIIFDEPEIHLHPSAMAELVKVIHELLDTFDSYAIISTHSPMVLQDIPCDRVTLFERIGNVPRISKLPHETFGENISTLNNIVFGTIGVKELYKEVLEKLSRSMTFHEVMKLFNNKLSFNAQLYLSAIKNGHESA